MVGCGLDDAANLMILDPRPSFDIHFMKGRAGLCNSFY